ncbi:autotransporter-associated beta strand repeat-containing protein, partial [Sandarakinorhabdus sp.]|uniref:beta strand repeat-containing protein n=1 Tax=Sandarakinorhabdus sp. TaxID=1916663 RepID=UPI00286DB233
MINFAATRVSENVFEAPARKGRLGRFGVSLSALMLAGTALAPAAAQVADLGGGVVNISNFGQLSPANPAEITNGLLRITPSSATVYGGDMTDSGGLFSLQKLGVNALTLSGVNTYSGATTISAGTLFAGSATGLSAFSTFTINGSSILDVAGFSSTVGGLAGGNGGTVTNSGADAVFTVSNAGNTTFGGRITGGLRLVKTGSGQLTLNDISGLTSFTGGTELNSGSLRVGSNTALGGGDVTVTGASALSGSTASRAIANNVILNDALTVSGDNFAINGLISGAGNLVKTGSSTVILGNAVNSFTGGVVMSQGIIDLGGDGSLGTGTVTFTANAVLGVANVANNYNIANNMVTAGGQARFRTGNAGTTMTISGNISGNDDVFMGGGDGILVLAGNNSYTGTTEILTGVIGIGHANALGNGTDVIINGPGPAGLASFTAGLDISKRIRGEGLVTYDTRGFDTVISGQLRDLNAISGQIMTLEKRGAGILTITNASAAPATSNNISGGVTVADGTLNLIGRLSTGITVNSGATLAGTGGDFGGTTTIQSGGTLSPGDARVAGSVGTLSFSDLTLDAGSTSRFGLAAPNLGLGGANGSDFVVVNNALVLGGNLDITGLAGFAQGSYALFRSDAGNISGAFGSLALPVAFTGTLSVAGNLVRLDVLSTAFTEFYWDGNGPFGDGTVDGGTQTWSLTNGNWTDVNGNLIQSWGNDVAASNGYFTAGTGTVTVDTTGAPGGALNFKQLNFSSDGYVVVGGDLAIDAGAINTDAGITATFNNSIGGVNGLTKAGLGTLVLGGANAFTGGLAIGAGTLAASQAAALGVDDVSVTAPSTLRFDAAMTVANNINAAGIAYNIDTNGNDVTLTGSLSGGGADKEGAGTLTLANVVNAQPGTLAINGGGVNLLGAIQGNVSASLGTTLSGTGTVEGLATIVGTIAPGATPGAAGTLTADALTLSGSSAISFDLGLINVVGGSNDLLVSNGNLALGGTLNVNALAGFNVGVGAYRIINYGGALSDSGLSLGGVLGAPPVGVSYVIDTGTVGQVNLLRSYAGEYNWDGGDFGPDGGVDGGDGTFNLTNTNWTNADGTFNLAWGNQAGLAGTVGNFGGAAGAVTLGDTLNFRALNFLTSGYILSGGALSMDAGILNVASGTAEIGSALTGTNGLIKAGAGQLILTGVNSYTGGTLLLAGSVGVGNDLALSTGDVGMTDGTSILTVGGARTLANNFTLTGVTAYDTTAGDLTLGGTVAGGGVLTKQGAGTLVLTGTNSYGSTNLTAGNIRISNGSAIGAGALTTAGGTGLIAGLAATAQDITLVNAVTLGAGTTSIDLLGVGSLLLLDGTIATNGNRLTLDGIVGGDGGLLVQNAGILTLNGANSYAGGTVVDGGAMIHVGDNAALGTGALALVSGGLRNFSGAAIALANNIALSNDGLNTIGGDSDLALNGVVSGNAASTLFKVGGNVLTLNNANTLSGAINLTIGIIAVGNNAALGTAELRIQDSGTLRAAAADLVLANTINAIGDGGTIDTNGFNLTAAGPLVGNGATTKQGVGNLTLTNAASSFGGTLAVAQGGLVVTGALTNAAAAVDVASGASLAGTGSIAGTVTIADGGRIGAGVGGVGVLTLGNLNLSAGSLVDFDLGAANTLGGPRNDRIIVSGNLVLGGLLNVT